jgi:MFS family permease
MSISTSASLPFSNKLEILICARILGGFGSGIIFILVPIYMKELMGAKYNGNIVDLLITQFGLGIFSQYFIGESKKFLV